MKKEGETETKKYLFGLIKKEKKSAHYNLDSINDFFEHENEIEMDASCRLNDLRVKRISLEAVSSIIGRYQIYTLAVEDSTSVMYLNTGGSMHYSQKQWNRISSLKENDCIDVLACRRPGFVYLHALKNKTLVEKTK